MKHSKRIVLLTLPLALALIGCGNTIEPSDQTLSADSSEAPIGYKYEEDEMYEKIWDTKVVHNETAVMIEHDDGSFYAELLYEPTRIISVRDYRLMKEYDESEYRIEGRRIYMSEDSTMPKLTKANISCDDIPSIIGNSYDDGKGGRILFTEGMGIVFFQVNVTYEHNGTWDGSIPAKRGNLLPRLHSKLSNKETVNMVIYGDSIFTGANASSKLAIEPFMDTFPVAFGKEIERKYGSEVNVTNNAVGGMMSDWGRANVQSAVNALHPDVVVIGFGMNDGSWHVKPSDYVDNMEFMIRSIQSQSPDTDIILMSTIVANPASSQNAGQENYLEPLREMASEYSDVILVDMTTFSLDLLKHKSSFELYANNINHPCDFLVRGYVANLMNAIEVK